MKQYLFVLLLIASPLLVAAETCYQVSAVEGAWSRTPENLCVAQVDADSPAVITLKSGLFFDERIVAVYNLDLLQRAKCLDCNQDVFGLVDPSNSSFNQLTIRFDGTRDITTMKEEGAVYIGATKLFYQSLE